MSRLNKSIASLLILALMMISGYVIFNKIEMINIMNKSEYISFLPKPSDMIRTFISNALFWISLAIFIILFILLIIIVFYPKNITNIKLKDNNGKLVLKKSAIESIVKQVVQDKGFIKNARVNIKMYKKKIYIKVKGDIIPRQSIIDKSEELKSEINKNLELFLGINHKIKMVVNVERFNKEVVLQKAKTRVE